MKDWNPEQYLQFQRQRTQPAIDLAERIKTLRPRTVVDIGCGPGNSTAVVQQFFPEAEIVGIDSSAAMIEKARQAHPELTFTCQSALELTGQFDLLFSNACLQWIPDHSTLIPRLMERLMPGGVLAVQVPMNREEPLFRLIREVTADPQWHYLSNPQEHDEVLDPEAYFQLLSSCTASFEQWETVYYHALPSHEALINWVRGARLRPYLEALSPEEAVLLERGLLRRAREEYPVTSNGVVLLRFRRFFFTAIR